MQVPAYYRFDCELTTLELASNLIGLGRILQARQPSLRETAPE